MESGRLNHPFPPTAMIMSPMRMVHQKMFSQPPAPCGFAPHGPPYDHSSVSEESKSEQPDESSSTVEHLPFSADPLRTATADSKKKMNGHIDTNGHTEINGRSETNGHCSNGEENISESSGVANSKKIDERDQPTPDNWIERDESMVRLTGNHPFNSEAPLSKLVQCGFITPARLHFVRNHGYVPKIERNEHRIEITG
ncbi:unnamed protein product [Didymodactylos carnosus]|uniref:Uncharacterized protein n=1 Tax=Didymodactylos carnosus TaxID=1234261 RepID=A0A815FPF5_9BILA|nr:unnamed protein product [Didymodactylos carnosus]CAF1328463.1 unnamed protein product [Didymodactylos carnosus]CAF4003057.1 unnamed protein product [Didymodactylos carnosus]CAF4180117.1 unnamed protein product [Didymodactylos carnosus]